MGVNALNRSDKETVSAVWYRQKNIDTATGAGAFGKHIKVKFEDKRNNALSQPIKKPNDE